MMIGISAAGLFNADENLVAQTPCDGRAYSRTDRIGATHCSQKHRSGLILVL
jgi:hypothetical protein